MFLNYYFVFTAVLTVRFNQIVILHCFSIGFFVSFKKKKKSFVDINEKSEQYKFDYV